MSIDLNWHLQCPTDRADEAMAIIDRSLKASVEHRLDFQKTNKTSLRVSFNAASLVDKETQRPMNQRGFDKAVQGIRTELAAAMGEQASFYPINSSYKLPRAL